MAAVGRPPRRPAPAPREARIDALDQNGRGVAHVEGKAVFIDGALPGESVRYVPSVVRRRHDEGRLLEVLDPSPDRVTPRCAHFGVCGGCALQHLAPAAQITAKERVLRDALAHIGHIEPQRWLEPLTGPVWNYRSRARFGVRHVPTKGGTLVGFRERASHLLARLERCEVLLPPADALPGALARLIDSLSCPDRIPQVEVAVGESHTVIVLRHLVPLTDGDRERLVALAREWGIGIALQPGGPETVVALAGPLDTGYTLPEWGVTLSATPLDFVQVNPALNRRMVAQVLELLDPAPGERVLELFAGLGNFTLPLARRAASVTAVEGDAGLVARAGDNARANGIGNVSFHAADLASEEAPADWLAGDLPDLVLLDPPRAGAAVALARLSNREPRSARRRTAPRRIVYVSCNPATLARDAGWLARERGWGLAAAGVMDMFPHTSHVESVAVFER